MSDELTTETLATLREQAISNRKIVVPRELALALVELAERSPELQPPPRGKRWCPDCGAARPCGEFYRARHRASGVQGYCKQHMNERTERSRAWRRAAEGGGR